ncbi:alanine/glycine:cation symporter family protein [Pseudemcibacter aquimaris]|uniref:alanine/glycine:cation symporter family protein n=1 Tax=Pseudemcibacter aquimaris TaxID=2857064 RepID=UPI002011EE55|nr:amino acid carrier protein [Pseudemcibacter aquimaris]MCC3861185.1 amino acid carrier protein [Pseudemcibacter aquimaris]WDU57960.1 amino acid carrier protein [Pseudemcibacter aquimaris]
MSLNDFLISIDSLLGSAPWFPFVLLGVGLFFSIYLAFPQIRLFKHAWAVLFDPKKDSKAKGETSHFQAMSMALSGTIGTGNIGGVGLAIYLGGPAAIFWMMVTAFVGMTTKFVEVSLSHKYRVTVEDGTVSGGPMYVMDNGLNWKPLAILFAATIAITSMGSGSMPQVNNMAQVLRETFNINEMVTGGVATTLLAFVIIGGVTRIASFTSKVVPIMAMLYLVGGFAVILTNYENIIPSFMTIFADAFTGSAAVGGFLGATFAFAFNRGVNRGLFSNEAGQGAAAIAHASAVTDEPVSEGVVALLEPFIDTIMICTLTGLVILSSGVWTEKHENIFQQSDFAIIEGTYSDTNSQDKEELFKYLNFLESATIEEYNGEIEIVDGKMVTDDVTILNARSVAEDVIFYEDTLTGESELYSGPLSITNGDIDNGDIVVTGKSLVHSAALTSIAFTKSFLGEGGKYIVAIALTLFAFSTAVSWSYYGNRCVVYLFGIKAVTPFRAVFLTGFFLASFADTTIIWTVAAITVVFSTLPNLLCMIVMRKEIKNMVNDYVEKIRP